MGTIIHHYKASPLPRVIAALAALLGLYVVVTSIYGGYHFFSDIPFWDQWDGYIGFYRNIQNGVYGAFWWPHMEHRIVLTRGLFWLDIALFGGWNVFTIIINYVLIAGIAWVLWHEHKIGRSVAVPKLLVGGILIGFLFSWIQNENLKWGFQSEGMAVNLFALLAFAQFSRIEKRGLHFSLAILFAVLSMLTMGNGIVTFGILIVQCFLQRRHLREYLLVAVAGGICAAIYFHAYTKPQLPIDPLAAATSFARLKFFLIFMGNPIFAQYRTLVSSGILGVFSLTVASILVIRVLIRREVTPYRAFLIAGYGFVVAAGMGAANSRWMLTLYAAVASRYATPVLLSFVLLTLLALDIVKTKFARAAAIAIPVVLMGYLALFQKNVHADNGYLYDWNLAALGQKIGLDRLDYDSKIFPTSAHDRYVMNANFAAAEQIGPYGRGWLHDAGIVKFDPLLTDPSLCRGYVDYVTSDDLGAIAEGWLVPHKYGSKSILIVLTATSGETVGYGVTGLYRPDVAKAVPGAAKHDGWKGFLKPGASPIHAYAFLGGKFCPLQDTPTKN